MNHSNKYRVILILLLYTFTSVFAFIYPDEVEEASFFHQLKDGMRAFSSVLAGAVQEVARHSKALASFALFSHQFIQSSVEEECFYSCPKGMVAVASTNYIPQANGCGSLGFNLAQENLPLPGMEQCCNSHDFCYDTCGVDKEDCDKEFRRCLYQNCRDAYSHQESNYLTDTKCKAGAKILYSSTLALGCLSYRKAQDKACKCIEAYHVQGQQIYHHNNRYANHKKNGRNRGEL